MRLPFHVLASLVILLTAVLCIAMPIGMLGQEDQEGSEFMMYILPSYARIEKGMTTRPTLRVMRVGNFTGPVRFMIDGAPEGIVVESPPPVTFGNGSLVNAQVTIRTFDSSPVGNYTINIVASSDSTYRSLEFKLEVAPSLHGDMVVSVTDTDGKPVPNAYVALFFKCCPVPRGPNQDEPMAEGFVDLNGTITFTYLREGVYSVGASAEGYLVGGAYIDVYGAKATSGVITMQARTWWDDFGHFVIVGLAFAGIIGGFVAFERVKQRIKTATPRRFARTGGGMGNVPRALDFEFGAS